MTVSPCFNAFTAVVILGKASQYGKSTQKGKKSRLTPERSCRIPVVPRVP